MKYTERTAHDARVIKDHAIAKANIERALIVDPNTHQVSIEFSSRLGFDAYIRSLGTLGIGNEIPAGQEGNYELYKNPHTGAIEGFMFTQTGIDKLADARINNPALNALLEGSKHTPRARRVSAQPPRSFG